MESKELQRAFRRGWLLVLIGVVYSVAFFFLAVGSNQPETPPTWDMDSRPFVPASSPFADGYPLPFEQAGRPTGR